jgi:hypothetical protein
MLPPRLARVVSPPSTSRWQGWYTIAILAIPALVLWRRDNALFTPTWFSDPWYYLGYFRTLIDFKRSLFPDAYFGSRLSWILPGFAVHSLFPPVVANFILHLGVHSVAALSFFAILRRTAGVRAAFLATLVFSVHPWLWAATGWDYVNGVGIAYFLFAMAALTGAARHAPGRRDLATAGAAIAGMVYAHFLWLSFAPLLLVYYAGLVLAWRRITLPQLAALSAPWLALGFGIVTAALSAANYALNGTFWFYGVSWNAAMRASEVFTAAPGIWGAHGLAPWLWFPLMAATAAAILIPIRLRREGVKRMAPALLFSAQLLLALAWMAYLQFRGIAMLGFYHYAAYLIPFAFLTTGALLWEAVDGMSERAYVLTCCAAAVGFAAAWYQPANGWMLPALQTACLGVVSIATGVVLGRRPAGTWLVLGGLLIFSAHAVNETAGLHGTREEYRRITDERENIERARDHDSVRFWFDETEPGSSEYAALNSLYLGVRLGAAFPQGGCEVRVQPGTLIVVPSAKAGAAELARGELSECWRTSSMKAVVLAADSIQRKGRPYSVALLRAVTDLSGQRPLRAMIGPAGVGSLQLASASVPVPLPLGYWTKESPDAVLATTAGGVDVRTPRGDYDYAMAYPPLAAPVTGRYRFTLRYSHSSGEFAFGAFPADNSRWLADSTAGYREGDGREIAFSVDLKGGEVVILRIANNNNHRDGRPASFRMLEVTATVAAAD